MQNQLLHSIVNDINILTEKTAVVNSLDNAEQSYHPITYTFLRFIMAPQPNS